MTDEPQQWSLISICVDPAKIHVTPDRSALDLGDYSMKARLVSQASIQADWDLGDEDATLDELERIGTAIVLAVARARRPAQAVSGVTDERFTLWLDLTAAGQGQPAIRVFDGDAGTAFVMNREAEPLRVDQAEDLAASLLIAKRVADTLWQEAVS